MLLALLSSGTAKAQLSTNPDKFLGNITTGYQVDYGGYSYYKYWNQLTCENESKWGSVEGTNGRFNWPANQINYCNQHKFPFKWHALIWGAQHPGWFNSSMTPEQRYKELVEWMDAIKKQYPNLELIDVANECINGHQADTYLFEEALGGKGVSGWDWLAKAFEMAHERWPNAILIYNDFNTFQWNTDQFIDICKSLRDAGAPIDAYGCQSHDLNDISATNFKNVMDKLQNQLLMPMYSTEYDINIADDNGQLQKYKDQIPYMWEKDYCAGVTLWGWHYGRTWVDHSGLIKDGKERPALTWLREYMKSDKAKNAKSPFPGMKKQVDLYIKPLQPRFSMGEPGQIDLRARMVDKTRKIERIDFYANNQLYCTLTEAPWVVDYTPGKLGSIPLKAVLTADDGQQYTRYGNVQVVAARSPYATMSIPGLVQAENFDKGVEGSAYHDVDFSNTGNKAYRSDVGVDFTTGNSGTVVCQTEAGEWMEYTVNVREESMFSYDLTASSGVEDAAVSLSLKTDSGYVELTEPIAIPCVKKNSWTSYKAVYGRLNQPLPVGKQIIRLSIEKGGAYLDKIQFSRANVNPDIKLDVALSEECIYEKDTVRITVTPTAGAEAIKNLAIYVDNVKQKTFTQPPYEMEYTPTEDGLYHIMAFANDTASTSLVSEMFERQLIVEKKRIPYKNTVAAIPGSIEAENFDQMGEGYSFHDSDKEDQGASKYRSDNEGVDIYKGASGYYVGNIVKDEWMDYTVDVDQAGIYDLIVTVATNTDRGQLQLFLVNQDGTETALVGKKYIAAYKNWNNYRDVKIALDEALPAGRNVIRIKFFMPVNFDKMTFALNEEKTNKWLETGIDSPEALAADTYAVYTTDGVLVGTFSASEGDNLGGKARNLTGKRGTYVVKGAHQGTAKTILVK